MTVSLDSERNRRTPSSLPKFASVAHEVFGISNKRKQINLFDRVKHLRDVTNALVTLKPFASCADAMSFQHYNGESGFPLAYRTPDWWVAYNKIKNDMSLARARVTYESIDQALGGLFLVLPSCDADMEVLGSNNHLIRDGNEQMMESRVFQYRVQQ